MGEAVFFLLLLLLLCIWLKNRMQRCRSVGVMRVESMPNNIVQVVRVQYMQCEGNKNMSLSL